MNTLEKLQSLRTLLAKWAISAYLQPVHDEYLSEYPPACYRRAEWLSGFSGSAGTVAVLSGNAALFVDGRYTLQAAQETDAALFETHNSGELAVEAWLARRLNAGDRVGYDPKLYTQAMLKRLQATLDKKGILLVPCRNLVDEIWQDRPPAPASNVFIHELKYAGETSESKRRRIVQAMQASGAEAALLTAPDSICWLLNIRARDVAHTPLLLCTAIIADNGMVRLYAEPTPGRFPHEVITAFGADVSVRLNLEEDLTALGKAGKRVLCDPQSAPVLFTQQLSGASIIEAPDPCVLPKATKNPVELQGMRDAHIRDGVAVTRLLCWLEHETGRRPVTEMEVCDKLHALRAAHPLFVEPSFTTISGSGPHGAIVHYRVTPESNRTLQKDELFLLDSGGQYPDGTTDITRTIVIGAPSPEMKNRFTRVLKGHIALALARFPAGTAGSQLDALARQYLWQAGLDYDHGTGHGVGHFLGVHEGPQRISKRGGDAALTPGMIVSNEPGYYKAGEYGIRIENLVAVVSSPTVGEKTFLSFETLTCVPIDTRLVEASMLSSEEKTWLNNYHHWIASQLTQSLSPDEQAWLKERCASI